MKGVISIRYFSAALLTAAAAGCVALACAGVRAGTEASPAPSAPDSAGPEAAAYAPTSGAGGYLVTQYGGRVCVFEAGSTAEPCVITDINASMLRRSDAEALARGIRASSLEELLMLLEDLGS